MPKMNFKKLRQMIEVLGNGNIVTTEKQVSSFVRLHLSTHGVIELIQSDEEKVLIESDENLADYFEVVNSGRTLYVTSEAKLRKPRFSHLLIKVYFRQINTLYNATHGDVITKGPLKINDPLSIKLYNHGNTSLELEAPSITLNAACHGDIMLAGHCGELSIKDSSHGSLNAQKLEADKVNLNNFSHGDLSLYAKEEITITHFGHGNILYYGPGQLKDIRNFGHGVVKHAQ